ncbi:MAG: sugar phosphate nucleotidyltransferase [Thermodesulfobacteriota bacterium]|nr:sugar phosphate nucleotidyltransferase [Thermodesulfobacteriota bacterium]
MDNIEPGWKALILAAGLGTRLLPYTRHTPKPLFTINNRPLLGIIIDRLIDAGCGHIVINTHHLAHKIETFVATQKYGIPIQTRHEPDILGTGGAIRNMADIVTDRPFLVINSDIFTDIDLAGVFAFHAGHDNPATLVLHDYAVFNTVAVDKNNCITGFARGHETETTGPAGTRELAFTGIHVMSPEVLNWTGNTHGYLDIITVYRKMIKAGVCLRAYVVNNHQWHDIGTPASYTQTALAAMAQAAFQQTSGKTGEIKLSPVAPDGADTCWWRVVCHNQTMIACDRGIRETDAVTETDSFVLIGRHLEETTVAVPRIHLADRFAGIVLMEDLGDRHLQTHLQTIWRQQDDIETVFAIYRQVIHQLVKLATNGHQGFDPAWTCQTPAYDKPLILEKECNYFARAFLSGFLGMPDMTESLAGEFEIIADMTLEHAVNGLMHRDMQSRNIIIKNGTPYFIDFQGARTGPVQYDLAALLIDPYTALPDGLQTELLDHYRQQLARVLDFDESRFNTGYACCAVTRNLQILGAFGFLTIQKNKPQFSAYIPDAATRLLTRLKHLETVIKTAFPRLTEVVEKALAIIREK